MTDLEEKQIKELYDELDNIKNNEDEINKYNANQIISIINLLNNAGIPTSVKVGFSHKKLTVAERVAYALTKVAESA